MSEPISFSSLEEYRVWFQKHKQVGVYSPKERALPTKWSIKDGKLVRAVEPDEQQASEDGQHQVD